MKKLFVALSLLSMSAFSHADNYSCFSLDEGTFPLFTAKISVVRSGVDQEPFYKFKAFQYDLALPEYPAVGIVSRGGIDIKILDENNDVIGVLRALPNGVPNYFVGAIKMKDLNRGLKTDIGCLVQ